MTADQKHCIRTVRYDIQFDDKEKAHQLQNSISALQTSKINELLNTVLNAYSEEKILLKFDTVALDLGNIDPSNFEQELLDNIEKELTLFLAKNNDPKSETHDSEIRQLEYFLLYGHFPWNAVISQTPNSLLKNILLTNIPALQELLLRLSKNKTAHKRLATQFSKKTFEKMVRQFGGETGNASVEENNKIGIIGSNSTMLGDLFKDLTNLNRMENVPINNLEQTSDPLFVNNAGLIILSPFLGTLFEKSELLQNGDFRDEQSKMKAVQLLAYAATGSLNLGEEHLVIPKVLSGLAIELPVDSDIQLKSEDKELVNSLLSSITQQWNPLKNSSIETLRESFLQRNGKLEDKEDFLQLHIETQGFDILLDQIPWNIGMVKTQWMAKLLQITWR